MAEKIGKMTNMKHYNPFIKTALLFAVLICCIKSNAQTYNNWLLDDGNILNLNTNPPSIDKIDFDNHDGNFSLSDNDGNLLLYGGKLRPPNNNSNLSNYVIKNNKNQTLVSFPSVYIRNTISCKSVTDNASYYVAIIYNESKTLRYAMRLYRFDNNGVLQDSLISKDVSHSHIAWFMPQDNGDVILFCYINTNKTIESYKLSKDIIKKTHTYNIKLPVRTDFAAGCTHIIQLKNGNKIIVSSHGHFLIMNYDINTENISLSKEINGFNDGDAIALSANDKYLIAAKGDRNKLIRYKLSNDFDFDNGEIIYEFKGTYVNDIQLGEDGKLYVLQNNNTIKFIDGIETDNITVGKIDGIIESNSQRYFPKIPRIIETKSAPCPEIEKPKIICE